MEATIASVEIYTVERLFLSTVASWLLLNSGAEQGTLYVSLETLQTFTVPSASSVVYPTPSCHWPSIAHEAPAPSTAVNVAAKPAFCTPNVNVAYHSCLSGAERTC